jgi:hypothetical protein
MVITNTVSDKYDWVSMKNIRLVVDDNDVVADIETQHAPAAVMSPEAIANEQTKLLRASKIAKYTTLAMTLILLILWPMPLYGTGYIFSEKFFAGWVIVGIIWLLCSSMAVGVYPLWEGRESLARNFGGMWKDITGKGGKRGRAMQVVEGEKSADSGTHTPNAKEVEATTVFEK